MTWNKTHTHTVRTTHTGLFSLFLTISKHTCSSASCPAPPPDNSTHTFYWPDVWNVFLEPHTRPPHLPLITVIRPARRYFSVIKLRHQQRNHIRRFYQENTLSNLKMFRANKVPTIRTFIPLIQVNLIQFIPMTLPAKDKLMTAVTTRGLMLGLQQSQKPLIWLDYHKPNRTSAAYCF